MQLSQCTAAAIAIIVRHIASSGDCWPFDAMVDGTLHLTWLSEHCLILASNYWFGQSYIYYLNGLVCSVTSYTAYLGFDPNSWEQAKRHQDETGRLTTSSGAWLYFEINKCSSWLYNYTVRWLKRLSITDQSPCIKDPKTAKTRARTVMWLFCVDWRRMFRKKKLTCSEWTHQRVFEIIPGTNFETSGHAAMPGVRLVGWQDR